MRLAPAVWEARAGLPALLAALDAAGDATRLVGGVVRDTLLGLTASDFDLATRLPPQETRDRIAAAGFKAVPTGLAHGTVTAVLPSGPVEVTTLRRDVTTDGRRATVAFTDDWREDAARRDFTINALFARVTDGAVIDFFDGKADLAARRVRFIGDPLRRIAEDHLRILRFFRFHARFGEGEPDDAGFRACAARANDLMALSRERIAGELLKLLGVADPAPTIALMIYNAILLPVLPEAGPGAFARLMALTDAEALAGVDGDPVRRLAAILPDDPAISDAVAARLKFSVAIRKRLALANAGEPFDPADVRALAYRVGHAAALDRALLADLDGGMRLAVVETLRGWRRPTFPMRGGDLVALGLPPGPAVAATLRTIERRWIEEGFPPAERVRAIAAGALDQALDRQ